MKQFKEDEEEVKQKQEMMAYFTSVSSTLMDLANTKHSDGTWQIPLNQRDEQIEVSYQMPFVKKVSVPLDQSKSLKNNTGSKRGTPSNNLPGTPRPSMAVLPKESPKKKEKMVPNAKIPSEKKAIAAQSHGTTPVKVVGDTDKRKSKSNHNSATPGPSKERNKDDEYAAYQKDWGLTKIEQSSKKINKPTFGSTHEIDAHTSKAPKSQENVHHSKKNINKQHKPK